ncbi:hypothetical protein DPMN_088774 [Dreissena polymorpha]|uniref:Uncharacterized protein n=1 Tax=Dreissena polymorpha TaxID=45954 RepID=A0A9D4KUQ3_DREPO|nr:hypothetical protein DPMN_088774 [Dreissena polymorpha]
MATSVSWANVGKGGGSNGNLSVSGGQCRDSDGGRKGWGTGGAADWSKMWRLGSKQHATAT